MIRALVIAAMLPSLAMAKPIKEDDPRHANHFSNPQPVEKEGITVNLADPWARAEQSKMKIDIKNKTPDYVVYRHEESRFVFPSGEFAPKAMLGPLTKGHLVIKPQDTGMRQLVVDGADFHHPKLKFTALGIYRLPVQGAEVAAPDFQIPLSVSKVDAGPFSCGVPGKVKQETDETKFQFVCTYNGEENTAGIVDPARIQVKLEDGKVFANDDRKMDSKVVFPGDEFKFNAVFHVDAKIVDMQFATMHVVFNDTFRTGTLVAVPFETVTMTLDAGLTAAKND